MMTVRAVEKGTGRVRTGRIGGGSGSGGSVAPAFQADFTALSALPAGFSFARASNAMVTDNTGKLTYAPNNLLTHSDDLTNATYWTQSNVTVSSGIADPLGGTGAFTVTAGAINAQIFQSLSKTGNFVSSYWVRRRTGSGTVNARTPDGNTNVPMSLTGSWQQFSTNSSDGSGAIYSLIQITTSGDAIDVYLPVLAQVTYETTPRTQDQVLTGAAAYYGPRSDFAWNGSAWIAVGLLIEEQRTNLILQSDNLPAGWSPEFLTFGTGGTSPSGTTAQKLIEGVGSSRYSWLQAVSLPSAIYTLSFYAKENGRRYVTASMGATTTRIAFDLVSGTITQNDANASGTITSLGNGLYRCTLTSVSAVAIDYIVFGLSDTGTPAWDSYGRTVYTATGSGAGIYFDDVQLEAGSFATSYIPTTTAAVTRSADIAQLTGGALAAIAGASVTALIEFDTSHSQPPAYYAGFDLSGGANLTEFWSDGKIYVGTSTGQLILDTGLGSLVPNTNYRYGLTWDGAGASACGNGGTVATGTYSAPAAFTTATIGANSAGAANISSHIRSLAIYNARRSNADLQTISVVGAAF